MGYAPLAFLNFRHQGNQEQALSRQLSAISEIEVLIADS
jgi:hypothetical protein